MPSVIPTAVWGRVRVPSGPQESSEQSGLFAFMAYYVYIIQSLQDNTYYKGFSEQPQLRLVQHNNGECDYTSRKRPWRLVYVEQMPTKRAALIRERNLKKADTQRINALIHHTKNIVRDFQ